MSQKRKYKRFKGGSGRFVQLPEYLQVSEAWVTMQPGPRALYIELKRIFNGRNNGEIFLSHRDAAKRLNVHRNTVGKYFNELEARGFIRCTERHHLGSNGDGKASKWALEEEASTDGTPPTKSFMKWRSDTGPSDAARGRSSISKKKSKERA